MKTLRLIVIIWVSISLHISAIADEGMWIPMLLGEKNYAEMQRLGLKLSPEQLYSINNASLKDAIVMLDHGSCTGEIISDQGLLLTNHHCGYGQIQAHSSVEHDYLTDGFWAKSKEEELPNPGKTVSFLVRIEDVTSKVLNGIKEGMSLTERDEKIAASINAITEGIKKEGQNEARVAEMFDGNEYFLFVYETYTDVRLVGAPPSAIGKFGGDTDNWMWPRHTGDFSLFRVYCSPDGKPAPYSKDNVPLKPKSHLPISVKGMKENDFAMIWGYPGSTSRYLTSWGIDLALEQTNAAIVKIREKKLAIMSADMDANAAVRIQYASKYARTANYWKYFQGQTKGLKKLNVLQEKRNIEEEFTIWIKKDPAREKKYGNVLPAISAYYAKVSSDKSQLASVYYRETLPGCEIILFAFRMKGLLESLKKNDFDNVKKKYEDLAASYYKDYNLETDKKITKDLLGLIATDLPESLQPDIFKEIIKKHKGNFGDYVEKLYASSIYASLDNYTAFLKKPDLKKLENDPAHRLMESVLVQYRATSGVQDKDFDEATRLFAAGLQEMYPDRKFYPNANSTMRCTYGSVLDYFPADAVHYSWQTTLDGVIQKEDPTNDEFIVPAKLKELYNARDYGVYGENGKMPVCFLTNNDITGGNSGSPVINANGELIGTAFDGNWEAMSCDIAFVTDMQRTIACDIRYVLFIIDKYAGASNLIAEMEIRGAESTGPKKAAN
ncbi:MAG: S46 family peptidase [Bacteroidetes bacterium]|nr:S46 family peptidase [Bacteroidota bacterium]MBU1718663.1 S46 family peptidase [Bacteroidota bacterium]